MVEMFDFDLKGESLLRQVDRRFARDA